MTRSADTLASEDAHAPAAASASRLVFIGLLLARGGSPSLCSICIAAA